MDFVVIRIDVSMIIMKLLNNINNNNIQEIVIEVAIVAVIVVVIVIITVHEMVAVLIIIHHHQVETRHHAIENVHINSKKGQTKRINTHTHQLRMFSLYSSLSENHRRQTNIYSLNQSILFSLLFLFKISICLLEIVFLLFLLISLMCFFFLPRESLILSNLVVR